MNLGVGAGFYACEWGPLPFAIGDVPSDEVFVCTVNPSRNGAK